jgi:putative tryptophan/tyrosine transport system substrate-binding protein
MPVIGFVHSARPAEHLVALFRDGLRETGYVDGRNAAIEFRSAEGSYDRLPELMAGLVAQRVAVIVAKGGEVTALAAKAATTTIPIVFNVDRDPTQLGLVDSLNRLGRNVTGFNQLATELGSKGLGLLHTLVPEASVIAVLANPRFHPAQEHVSSTQQAARTLGRRLRSSRRPANPNWIPLSSIWPANGWVRSSLPPIRFSSAGGNGSSRSRRKARSRPPMLVASTLWPAA